jgi:hypothetical protein
MRVGGAAGEALPGFRFAQSGLQGRVKSANDILEDAPSPRKRGEGAERPRDNPISSIQRLAAATHLWRSRCLGSHDPLEVGV